MKYVLIVMYMFVSPDGELGQTKFLVDFDSRNACLAAIEETETKVMSRVEARSLTLECRPMTPWDEPMSWAAYMEDDVFVASE